MNNNLQNTYVCEEDLFYAQIDRPESQLLSDFDLRPEAYQDYSLPRSFQYQEKPMESYRDVMEWGKEDCMNLARSLCRSRDIGLDIAAVNIENFENQEFENLVESRALEPSMAESATDVAFAPDEDYHITDISHDLPGAAGNWPMDVNEIVENILSAEKDCFDDVLSNSSLLEEESDSYQEYPESMTGYSLHQGHDLDLHEVPGSPCIDDLTVASSPVPSRLTSSESGCDVLSKIKTKSRKRERGPKNWEYLMRLLADKSYNPSVIRWEDEEQMTFRIVKPSEVAHIWGKRSNKPQLSYDNFARGLRYHYKTGSLKAVSERQLVYKCGPKARKYLEDTLNYVF